MKPLFHGAPIYEIANLLGLDASTLGNHEFDYGWRRVQEFMRIAHFPVVSANIVDKDGKTVTRSQKVTVQAGRQSQADFGELSRNVVPSEATVSMDIRLVKGLDGQAQVAYVPFAKPVPTRRVVLAWRKSFTRMPAIDAICDAVAACDLPGVSKLDLPAAVN